MAGCQVGYIRVMGHDVVDITVSKAGVDFDFQALWIAGHHGFLHAVKAFIQPNAVSLHVFEKCQIIPVHTQFLQNSRSDVQKNFHTFGMGIFIQAFEFFKNFIPGFTFHRKKAGENSGKSIVCCFINIGTDLLRGIVFGVNRNS